MPKASNREKILAQGLRVVHERGLAGASVRDIVQAAGVPQGSFTNHFASKEAFGLEILDLYFAGACALIIATLRNEALAPLDRLRAFIDANTANLKQNDMRRGCLFGNFAAEAGVHGDELRQKLVTMLAEVRRAIAACLQAAIEVGELPAGTACDDVAGFIVSSLQGAILLAKAEGGPAPVERFRRILFSTVLR